MRAVRWVVTMLVTAFMWLRAKKEALGWKKFLLRGAGWFGVAMVMYLAWLWITLPDVNDPKSLFAAQSTVITDRNAVELYRLYSEEDRTYIPGDQIPLNMKKAIVAIEDSRYYTRGCLDLRALARAVFLLGKAGGASTLTRQLARNALDLQKQNVMNRKLKELILGCQLESKFSKEELLELYLNWIPFGQNAYGVEQASHRYFGIAAKDLTLAQSAVLASLPQAPTYYSPYGSHIRTTVTSQATKKILDGTITSSNDITDEDFQIGLLGTVAGSGSTVVYVGGRSDQVLKNMLDQELITKEERDAALIELRTLTFKQARENIRAPHFVLWVKDQVEKMLASQGTQGLLEQGGLVIETTLDWNLQQEAEKAVSARAADTARLYEAQNIALVSLDPKTREVLAYVGNMDYKDEANGGKIDMVQVPRQPGSTFKPFVYAAAFMQGYGPGSVLYDVQTKFGTDQPSNFDGTFWGITSARRALAGSRNIPAIKMFFLGGGEDSLLDLTAKMGVLTPRTTRDAAQAKDKNFGFGWPLAIGAAETPLIEMVNGYAVFADNGVSKPTVSIRKITTSKGVIVYQSEEDEGSKSQVLDPRIAYEVTSILSDPSARPDAFWSSALTVPGYEAAAKTGTSNKCLDRNQETNVCKDRKPESLWTIGYTPDLVTGVWVGNATSKALSSKADGLNVAAPIWKAYMTNALKVMNATSTSFTMPDGLVQPQISALSAQLPTDCTPVEARTNDVFLSENAPNMDDPACVRLLVDKVTGLLASDSCPADAQEEQSFLQPKSELPDRWPLWEQGVQTWADAMRKKGSGALMSGSGGLKLPLMIAPTQKCDVSLTPGRLEKPTLSIVWPTSGDSVPYPSFQPRLSAVSVSGIQQATFTVDNKIMATASSLSDLPILRMPSSISKGGTHTLTVTIADKYFNKATQTVSFQFGEDKGAPTVRLLSPENSATLKTKDILHLSADASDPEGPVKYVEFYLDDTLLARKSKDPYRAEYPLKDVAPGKHTVSAVATDLSGQTSTDSVNITVE